MPFFTAKLIYYRTKYLIEWFSIKSRIETKTKVITLANHS